MRVKSLSVLRRGIGQTEGARIQVQAVALQAGGLRRGILCGIGEAQLGDGEAAGLAEGRAEAQGVAAETGLFHHLRLVCRRHLLRFGGRVVLAIEVERERGLVGIAQIFETCEIFVGFAVQALHIDAGQIEAEALPAQAPALIAETLAGEVERAGRGALFGGAEVQPEAQAGGLHPLLMFPLRFVRLLQSFELGELLADGAARHS